MKTKDLAVTDCRQLLVRPLPTQLNCDFYKLQGFGSCLEQADGTNEQSPILHTVTLLIPQYEIVILKRNSNLGLKQAWFCLTGSSVVLQQKVSKDVSQFVKVTAFISYLPLPWKF